MSAVFDELPVVSALTDEADSPSEGRGIELRIMERELRPGDLGDRGGLCPVPGRDVGGGEREPSAVEMADAAELAVLVVVRFGAGSG